MESKSLNFIKTNWIVLAFLAQIIGTWFVLNNTVNDHEKRISDLENYREQETLVLTDIQSRLASIETSILFIKDRLK